MEFDAACSSGDRTVAPKAYKRRETNARYDDACEKVSSERHTELPACASDHYHSKHCHAQRSRRTVWTRN